MRTIRNFKDLWYQLKLFLNLQKGNSLGGNWEGGGGWWIFPHLNFLFPPHTHLIEIVIFLGGAFPLFLCSNCLERTYFQPFSIVILICVMNILFPWNLSILYVIYYLSPNGFSYIDSVHFLHTECEGPCLIT